MPQRFLRPQITNSDRWNSVGFAAQSLYIRLITLVDDYGRYDGRASVIWAHCFAVWNDKHPQETITMQQTEQMLQELAASRLIDLYELQDKKIVQLEQWTERIRDGVAEKWPANPEKREIIEDLKDSAKVAATSCKNLPSSSSSSSSSSPGGKPPGLKMSEQIKLEKELTRVTNEIRQLGQLSDYDPGNAKHTRLITLLKRQKEICKTLGVVA